MSVLEPTVYLGERCGLIPCGHIVWACAAACGVDVSDMLSKSNSMYPVMARHLAVFALRQLRGRSFPEIAASLNQPSHSTSVSAAHSVEKKMLDNRTARRLREARAKLVDILENGIPNVCEGYAGGVPTINDLVKLPTTCKRRVPV